MALNNNRPTKLPTPANTERVSFSVNVPYDLMQRLRRESARRGVTITSLIVQAAERALQEEEPGE